MICDLAYLIQIGFIAFYFYLFDWKYIGKRIRDIGKHIGLRFKDTSAKPNFRSIGNTDSHRK